MMSPDDARFRVCVPKNMPEHGWPVFPDFDRYPDLRDAPPAWWHWYRIEPYGPSGGRVIEVAGDIRCDASDPLGVHASCPIQVVRTVMLGSFEAARAAFRLLTGKCLCTAKAIPEGGK